MKFKLAELKNTGRKLTFLIFIAMSVEASSQDQCLPVGWAAQNGGATGGGNTVAVTVSTLSDLQSQANSSGAKVIYVSGTMGAGAGTRVSVSSNKTIFGLPGAVLNGGFDIKNASNVIIRNMIIKGPGAVDVDGVDCMTIDNSTNVWIDHCNISDGQDGNMDIVNGSNYVSVTWTKFSYTSASVAHKFSNLIGNSDTKITDRTKLKVTMMFNYWTSGCAERMPRVRFGQVHVVNNLFDSPNANHCIRAGIEADILVESNVFKGVNKPIDLYENNFTSVTARNNLFTNTSGNTAGSGTSFTPPYTLNIIAAANVETLVKSCVGATLTAPNDCPCGNPLPVDLISFSVKQQQNYYLLKWLLSNNESLEEIELEGSSDGIYFERIVGLGNNITGYLYLNLNSPFAYVRLKFTEEDGSISFSPARALGQPLSMEIYPNPFMDHINIRGIHQAEIKIYSLTGIILHKEFLSEPGIINLNHLEKGIYVLHLIDSVSDEVKKVILTKLY